MRALLVIPTYAYQYGYPVFVSASDFPVGFAYLASSLRKAGHQVYGLNLNNEQGYRSAHEMIDKKIRYAFDDIKPELIGLGGLCTDFRFIKDALQIVKKHHPDIPVVLGGGIINNDAEFVFKLLRPDFCIVGEGEETIVKLADKIANGKGDYNSIDNLGYWKNGRALFTKVNYNYIDINERPFPYYEPFGIKRMLDNYSLESRYLYRYPRPNPRPMGIVMSRSCPFSCTFCIGSNLRPRYRARSIENILQEIKIMYERYDFNVLVILDELFAVDKLRMREFCNALIEAKRKHNWDFVWQFETHISASLDYETLKLAKEAGCYFFSCGLESASPRVLASMNKKTKVTQIAEAIKVADLVGIGFGGNFIFGDVAESQETISETMDFFAEHCMDIHLYLSYIQPYPGSKLFETCIEKGIIKDKTNYYEKIGEKIWNMTLIPDRLWYPWIYYLYYLANRYLWVKPTKTIRCKKEGELANGKEIWGIWARCPHCGKVFYCRELLGKASTAIGIMRSNNKRKMLWLGIKMTVLFLLNSNHPLFKQLKPILGNETLASPIVTGCHYCNKRLRIEIPISTARKLINVLEDMLLSFLRRKIGTVAERK